MITALHALIYAHDADAARAFFRDVLQFPAVDTGGGWLIFRTGPSELGVHPASWEHEGERGGTDQAYDVSLVCDDLAATMAELAERGAEFAGEVAEQDWGTTVEVVVPGARPVLLYQPKYDPPALGVEPWEAEARALKDSGHVIGAVKLVHARSGLGLKESKDYVDRL